jgi:hypothetical protein
VLRSLRSMQGYRERLEAERKPGDPPLDDTHVMLNAIANFLKLQGMLIAHMAMEPDTSEELMASSVHAAERVPAWMELRVFGSSVDKPGHNWALGLAQLLGEQRAAIEAIVEEQVDDPRPIMEILAAAPVPTGEEGEDAKELFALAGAAMSANFQATLATARDLDEWFEEQLAEGLLEFDEDEEFEDEELDEDWEDAFDEDDEPGGGE